ncbi:nuclear transport factor 2 family protein [Flavobacterium sp. LS1R49]|uniref:Nuclear transport factor 2 family protein n=1 Tax=Flavobacterium shii TaxID=2987687 RepID=A0A9X2ZDT7_9FLAO|nr:nuclear transport factor 2 family protein [Flavobacterium shii]MCV9929536.1 nuclear transport factor 2 family protein [Flavobacterium shii]
MKRFIKLLFLIFIFNSTIACSQTKLKQQGIMETDKIDTNKSEILDVTRQLTQLMIDKNTVEIKKILDQGFTLTHITGYVQSKDEWFSEIESERMKYYSYTEVKTSVKIDEDKAVFVGQNLLDARIWGTRNNWRLQQTMHLEKRKGKWIILNSVAITF